MTQIIVKSINSTVLLLILFAILDCELEVLVWFSLFQLRNKLQFFLEFGPLVNIECARNFF
jgi:hypothetical protein